MRSVPPVSVVGLGGISCAGANVTEIFDAAFAGRSAIGLDGTGRVTAALSMDFPTIVLKSRAAHLAAMSLMEAVTNAGWEDCWRDPSTAIIIATTSGQISLWESKISDFLCQQISAEEFAKALQAQSLGSIVEVLREAFGFCGPSSLVTTACAAGTQALALGAQMIRSGRVQRCLVGGVEVLSELTLHGFRSLRLISDNPARPFDRDRSGINLSEGAAWVALSSDESEVCVLGHGLNSDAFHMTAPHPEGRGLAQAIKAALNRASLNPEDIDWVHAHGTGSPANDTAESHALNQIFGRTGVAVASSKWLHGHLLGGSGLLESLLCVRALETGRAFGSLGVQNPDPALALNLAPPKKVQRILKTTLGFGGSNAAIILSRQK